MSSILEQAERHLVTIQINKENQMHDDEKKELKEGDSGGADGRFLPTAVFIVMLNKPLLTEEESNRVKEAIQATANTEKVMAVNILDALKGICGAR